MFSLIREAIDSLMKFAIVFILLELIAWRVARGPAEEEPAAA